MKTTSWVNQVLSTDPDKGSITTRSINEPNDKGHKWTIGYRSLFPVGKLVAGDLCVFFYCKDGDDSQLVATLSLNRPQLLVDRSEQGLNALKAMSLLKPFQSWLEQRKGSDALATPVADIEPRVTATSEEVTAFMSADPF